MFALPIVVFLIEAGWYALVALVFSAALPRRAYLAAKKPLDRFAALVLGGLGLRLVLEGLVFEGLVPALKR